MSSSSGPIVLGLIGHPVSQSLSPKIFSFLSQATKQPLMYRALDLTPEELPVVLGWARRQALFRGWNVTLPHKEAVIRFADRVSADAKAAGAANVLVFDENKVVAQNTDVLGVRDSLQKLKLNLKGKTILIFGAGGAARSVALETARAGAHRIFIANRTRDRAYFFCKHFKNQFKRSEWITISYAEAAALQVDLVVNTTPVGMKSGGEKAKFYFPTEIPAPQAAFDVVYAGGETPFLKEAKKHKIPTLNGLDMLTSQALASWELWIGKLKNKSALQTRLAAFLKTAQRRS